MSAACRAIGPSDALRERFVSAGQGQVFAFWDRLDEAGRARLSADAADVDLDAIAAASPARPRPGLRLEPAPIERLPEHGGSPRQRAAALALGEERLAAGRVAALVMAGGQATRLGGEIPKGALILGPCSARTLFGLQAEKLRGLRRRYGARVPWCVMTSDATDAATRALFQRERCFGLPEEDVHIFRQGRTPAIDAAGRLLLEAPDRLVRCPDGHGGSLPALAASGVLDQLAARGIEQIASYQVDNPLVRIADPVFVGMHVLRGAEMSCKVLRKREPAERLASVGSVAGRIRLVEYTELDAVEQTRRGPDGELALWAGSIGMHVLDLGFVRRVAGEPRRWLPLHPSLKRIPCLDPGGAAVVPAEPNGYKLERFVFDAVAASRCSVLLEVRREEEYSPIKNASGGESVETARRDLEACYRRWIEAAGLTPPATRFELDHSCIDGSEDAQALGAAGLDPDAGALRLAPGESSPGVSA